MCWKVKNISQIPVQFTAWLPRHSLWYSRGCVKMAGGVESSSSLFRPTAWIHGWRQPKCFFSYLFLFFSSSPSDHFPPVPFFYVHPVLPYETTQFLQCLFCRTLLSMLWHTTSLYLLYLVFFFLHSLNCMPSLNWDLLLWKFSFVH